MSDVLIAGVNAARTNAAADHASDVCRVRRG